MRDDIRAELPPERAHYDLPVQGHCDHRSWAREQPLRPEPASEAPTSLQSPNHEQDTDGGFGDLAWNDEGPSGQF